jgi:Ca2+-binding RTX toxin-like protein
MPPNNEEYGFWRIAVNGTTTKSWSTLVLAGDIVRLGWTGGGFHTLTVVEGPRASDGKILVTDNTDTDSMGNSIYAEHWVNYDDVATADARSNSSTVTIYRLSADHRFLTQGSKFGDSLYGTVYNDDMRGFNGADSLHTGVGDDQLRGGDGYDHLYGGKGNDEYFLDDVTAGKYDVISENILVGDNGTDTVHVAQLGGLTSYTMTRDIEIGTMSTHGKFTLIGNSSENYLYGNTGQDTLKGLAASDHLNGGGGKDTLYGGADDDLSRLWRVALFPESLVGGDQHHHRGRHEWRRQGRFSDRALRTWQSGLHLGRWRFQTLGEQGATRVG